MIALAEDTIELRVPSKPEYVSIVRTLITDLARRMAFTRSAVEDLQVAISEACANVVCHAYPEEDADVAEIVIRCSTCDGRLVMEVEDTGRGVSTLAQSSRDPDRSGGFGLVLIANLMDDVYLDSRPDQGTRLRMAKATAFARSDRSRPVRAG